MAPKLLDETVAATTKLQSQTIDPDTPPLFSRANWRNWFTVGLAIMTLIACGYDQSITWVIPYLESFNDQIGVKDTYTLATFDSLTQFAGMIASVFMPLFYDYRGRKFGFFWGNVIACVGIAISFFGSIHMDNTTYIHRYLYFFGRIPTIIGINLAAGCSWMYAAELAHPAHRAFFGGLFGICWTVGYFICNLLMFLITFTPYSDWQWRSATGAQWIFSIIVFIWLPFAPESPRTLISKGKREEARKVVKEWVGNNIASEIFVDRQMVELEEAFVDSVKSETVWEVYNMKPLWKTANSRRRVFWFVLTNAGLTLLNWGTSGGVFETQIYNLVGLSDQRKKTAVSLGQSVLSMVAAGVACLYLDKWGRRRTYLVTYALVVILGFIGVAAMEGYADTKSDAYGYLYIFSLYLGTLYSAPAGPTKLLFEAELLDYDIRARGKMLNDLTGKPANIAMNYIQAAVFNAVSFRSFWVAQGYYALFWLIHWWIMPETKNRTLEEVDEIWDHPSPLWTLLHPGSGQSNYVKHSLNVLKVRSEIQAGGIEAGDLAVDLDEKKPNA